MTVNAAIDAVVVVNTSVAPQALASNTTINGVATDLRTLSNQGHEWRVMAQCGVGTRTDGTYTFSIQDSADNSSFSAVTLFNGSMTAVSAANGDIQASYLPVAGRPYVRISVASTAVTSGGVVKGDLILIPVSL